MIHDATIDTATLAAHVGAPGWQVFDCRHDLADVEAGRRAYARGHIPGAIYVHLDDDLSSEPVTDRGRHPLPAAEVIGERFGRLGIEAGTQVVVYDAGPGAIAARLWWMLRYLGHDAVAVLDGGIAAWTGEARALESAPRTPRARRFEGRARREWLVTVDAVPGAPRLVDARDPARFRGELEPIDPVAGHIPGAVNHPFASNLGPDGRFLSPQALRQGFRTTLAGTPSEEAVFYCGSGVTACHNLLALARAGLPPGRLYVGSWSEWCADQQRPVALGD